MRFAFLCPIAIAAATLCAPPPARAQAIDTRAVPTYESVGLYWSNPPGANAATGCAVRFRPAGVGAYTQGLNLWFDAASNECRGSLVHLAPGTNYEAELSVAGALPVTRTVLFTTWPNQVPVQQTVSVPSGSGTLTINQGGTPLGYVVYQGAPGVLDAANAAQYNVYVNASYVVVRGLTLRGAQQHAIRIAPTVTDVIIEDNDISGWGRSRGGALGVNADSAVYAFCNSSSTLTRVTVQRNEIHDPRYTANSWSDGHPEGPQAITIEYCPGNHVIRHNEIFSTTGRYLNDAISGSDNFSTTGFPNADSDIYGNEITHCWDDAIEAEGGNRNVRIWGNYMDRTGTAIASTLTSVGPLYLFRNVYNRGRILAAVPPDQDDRQAMFKAGSDPAFGNGRRYVFHNTMLQAMEAGSAYGLGGSAGVSGTGSTKLLHNTVTRNNIWHLWRTWEAIYDEGPDNDFGWDMYNGSPGAPIANGIHATPTYLPGHGWQSEARGQYQLAPGTPGYDQGTRIANFNDAYFGAAPDVGAHEAGSAPMRFGIAASPGPAVGASADEVLVTHYYQAILRRAPDAAGLAFWKSEATRMRNLGVDVNEAWYALAMAFFFSSEYQAFNRDDAGFVTDLYNTFFNRPPDSGGLAYWTGQLGQGLPRDVALAAFLFSPEFTAYTQSIFGNTATRPEITLVMDFYRGLLARLPDSSGFGYWLQRFRTAQCQGAAAVYTEVESISSSFMNGAEYNARNRPSPQFVGDLYNAYLRRGGDLDGVLFWINQLNTGALTRNQVRQQFQASPEFSARVNAVASAGCV